MKLAQNSKFASDNSYGHNSLYLPSFFVHKFCNSSFDLSNFDKNTNDLAYINLPFTKNHNIRTYTESEKTHCVKKLPIPSLENLMLCLNQSLQKDFWHHALPNTPYPLKFSAPKAMK